MIHIKYRNKWEKQERLLSFMNIETWEIWYKDNPHIKILDYEENNNENPFTVWAKLIKPITWHYESEPITWTSSDMANGSTCFTGTVSNNTIEWFCR